jgi:hypothetical protein
MRIPIYPRLSSSGGIKKTTKRVCQSAKLFCFVSLFLFEIRDFLGFRMIFKVWLNQIFSNFNTMLYTIKYRLKFDYGVFHILYRLLQVPDPGHHHQTLDLLDVFNRTLYIKLLHLYIVFLALHAPVR